MGERAAAVPVYLALGGNLDGPLDHMRRAVAELKTRYGDLQAAGVYRSGPEGGADQPDYLNTAVRIHTATPATEVLAYGRSLEERAGRRRVEPGAPRPLDIDLLFHGDLVCATPDLTVPHPRWARRPFVVVPLLDLAPDWTDPVTGRSVEQVAREAGWTAATLERVLRPGALGDDTGVEASC